MNQKIDKQSVKQNQSIKQNQLIKQNQNQSRQNQFSKLDDDDIDKLALLRIN